jgi:hypothetical protein
MVSYGTPANLVTAVVTEVLPKFGLEWKEKSAAGEERSLQS